MVSPNRNWQLALLRMSAHSLSNCPANIAHKPRVLQDPKWWILLRVDLLKLVVSVEARVPPEPFELGNEAGVDEVDGALVDACFWLAAAAWRMRVLCSGRRGRWRRGTNLNGQPTI